MLSSHCGKWSSTSNTDRTLDQTFSIDQKSDPIKIEEQQSGSNGQESGINPYDAKFNLDPTIRRVIDGYSQLVANRIDSGWTCHLVTILFSQLPGNLSSAISIMKDEIQRLYSILLTRIHRKPRSMPTDQLPVLIAVADLPVYKHAPTAAPLVACNGGLHFHALLLLPPTSRLTVSLQEHFTQYAGLYSGEREAIRTIHATPVSSDHGRVVDYVFKTIMRGRISYDEGLVLLPRARRELMTA